MSTLTLILINIGAAATLSGVLAVVNGGPYPHILGPSAEGSGPRRERADGAERHLVRRGVHPDTPFA